MDNTDRAAATAITDHSKVVDSAGPLAVQNLNYSPDGKYIYFMPAALAEGGFSLFNVSQNEGRRVLISRGDLQVAIFSKISKCTSVRLIPMTRTV